MAAAQALGARCEPIDEASARALDGLGLRDSRKK
jgi:hypothetical protein